MRRVRAGTGHGTCLPCTAMFAMSRSEYGSAWCRVEEIAVIVVL